MARFSLTGGVLNGWHLRDNEHDVVLHSWHFMQLWDAILTRDKLNSGEWVLAEDVFPIESPVVPAAA